MNMYIWYEYVYECWYLCVNLHIDFLINSLCICRKTDVFVTMPEVNLL